MLVVSRLYWKTRLCMKFETGQCPFGDNCHFAHGQAVIPIYHRRSLERPMTMTIFGDLPKDLVAEEILCHVPATNLKRLGSTCKQWNRLFNGDRRFARNHTDKAAKQFLGLMKTRADRICPTIFDLDGPVPSVEVKSELSLVDSHSAQFDISRVFHCDGLLVCTSQDESRFVVWNPFTGETRWFRPSNRRPQGRTFVLGYYQEDNKKCYKILSLFSCRTDFEIYEFSSDSWRTLDDIIPPGWSDFSFLTVSLKGSTYWLAIDETKAQRNISLLKFDFSTEKSVPVPLPYQCDWLEVAGLSVVKEEKLSVILQRDVTCKTEIWVSNKIDETTQVVSWSKVLALDLSPDLQIAQDTNFLLDEEKKVVMICENWLDFEDETQTKNKDVISIVGEDNKVTQVDFGLEITTGGGIAILNYVPSLVQIEPAGGKRKRGMVQIERAGSKRKKEVTSNV